MYVNITSYFRGKKYRFNNIFGYLRSSLSRSGGVYALAADDTKSEKTRRFMDLAENPYLLSPSVSKVSVDLAEIPKYLCAYAKLLVWAHKHFYPLVWCLSHLRFGYFSSAIDTHAFCDVCCLAHSFRDAGKQLLRNCRKITAAIASGKSPEIQ